MRTRLLVAGALLSVDLIALATPANADSLTVPAQPTSTWSIPTSAASSSTVFPDAVEGCTGTAGAPDSVKHPVFTATSSNTCTGDETITAKMCVQIIGTDINGSGHVVVPQACASKSGQGTFSKSVIGQCSASNQDYEFFTNKTVVTITANGVTQTETHYSRNTTQGVLCN